MQILRTSSARQPCRAALLPRLIIHEKGYADLVRVVLGKLGGVDLCIGSLVECKICKFSCMFRAVQEETGAVNICVQNQGRKCL